MAIEALTIRAIGNSSGVLLPKELLELLNVKQGDKLFVTRTPKGVTLTPYDGDAAGQMETLREVMRDRRNLLRELAK
ncbi:MAG: AbrB/MazE/SpoVT family DNA-binding domain-containing protein [Xanthomonadales bacterium]|jgi:putative addiction module antidote|nr:AbrB/MazE/SpoVT family DNA-binding domain-containing protein [Xanthomonadales bacterium]